MASETAKAKAQLSKLSTSLEELEEILEPLFAQSLPESLLALEPIQQAKLQTVIPYLVYDLNFILLKTQGIDPKTHPVVPELDRVKQYFDKIKNAENPAIKKVGIDKAAAGRFIKHAITQAKYRKTPGDFEAEVNAAAGPSSVRVPVVVTSKMLEREQYLKDMKERDENEGSQESDLEVFDGGEGDGGLEGLDEPEIVEAPGKGKGKGKGKAQDDTPDSQAGSKRRRPMDPFAGYGETLPHESKSPRSGTPKPKEPPAKKTKTARLESSGASLQSTEFNMANTPGPGADASPINVDDEDSANAGTASPAAAPSPAEKGRRTEKKKPKKKRKQKPMPLDRLPGSSPEKLDVAQIPDLMIVE